MHEHMSNNPKMLAELCGGFLTWMGSAVLVLPLIWWATAYMRLANSNWHAALVAGIGAPITYLITGLIEHRRIA